MTGGRRAARASRASLAARGGTLSLVGVASLGLLLAVTSGSLPYLAASPDTDARFGALNHCLASLLEGPRLGWAAAPDGSRAATFGPRAVAVCGRDGTRALLPALGATAATFDSTRRLWVAAGGRLWREEAGRLAAVGDFAPVALAGHAGGVLALDAGGQLVSVAPDGAVRGMVTLPSAGGALSVGPDGALAAVVLRGGVLAYEARTLAPVRAASPCEVEGLDWLDGDSVLLACGPDGALALALNLRTGEWDVAPRGTRAPRAVEGCDNLPCSAAVPLASEPSTAPLSKGVEVEARGARSFH